MNIEPKDLSITELKKFHKSVREKIDCAKDVLPNTNTNLLGYIRPGFNPIKAEGIMILGMIDEEFELRGYDVEKLFKTYKKSKYFKS